jgi:hypothetical protein
MATYNITFKPNLRAFFNKDGLLVLGDATGLFIQGDPKGWGGVNPPSSSITLIEVFVQNITDKKTYYTSLSFGRLDILSSPYEFISVNSQIVIPATEFIMQYSTVDLSTDDFDNSKFPKGVYTVVVKMQGTYQVGADTVNWKVSLQNDLSAQMGISGVFNSSCLNSETIKFLSSKKCSTSKKYKSLMMYKSAILDYYGNPYLLQTYGETDKKLFQSMENICLGKQGGCQC